MYQYNLLICFQRNQENCIHSFLNMYSETVNAFWNSLWYNTVLFLYRLWIHFTLSPFSSVFVLVSWRLYNIFTPRPANVDMWCCYRVSCCLELPNRKQPTCHEWRQESKWLHSVSQNLHQVVMQAPLGEYAMISCSFILVTCYINS
jgi:hypothetical protein